MFLLLTYSVGDIRSQGIYLSDLCSLPAKGEPIGHLECLYRGVQLHLYWLYMGDGRTQVTP